jgi:ABC-type spermidine/putrescine transport system permease subunit I
MARLSFLTYTPRGDPSLPVTLANYARFLGDSYYLGIFASTLLISVAATVLCLVMGFALGCWIARGSRLRRALGVAAVLLPLLVSDVVRSYGWTILLADNGILAQAFALVHLPFPSLLRTPAAVVIGLTEVLLPFVVLPVVAAVASIPLQLDEAARSLGAGPLATMLRVELPLARPAMIVGAALVFLLSMSAFVTPSLMGGATVPVMGTLVYDQALSVGNWPFASAVGLLLLAFVLATLGGFAALARAINR